MDLKLSLLQKYQLFRLENLHFLRPQLFIFFNMFIEYHHQFFRSFCRHFLYPSCIHEKPLLWNSSTLTDKYWMLHPFPDIWTRHEMPNFLMKKIYRGLEYETSKNLRYFLVFSHINVLFSVYGWSDLYRHLSLTFYYIINSLIRKWSE